MKLFHDEHTRLDAEMLAEGFTQPASDPIPQGDPAASDPIPPQGDPASDPIPPQGDPASDPIPQGDPASDPIPPQREPGDEAKGDHKGESKPSNSCSSEQ